MSDLYYQANRERILELCRKRRRAYLQHQTFRDLVYARQRVWGVSKSIRRHQKRTAYFQDRLAFWRRRVEELELAWGQERAAMKKSKKVRAGGNSR